MSVNKFGYSDDGSAYHSATLSSLIAEKNFTVTPCPENDVPNADLTKVYVITSPTAVKVGISTNPIVRLQSLKRNSRDADPFKLHSAWLCVGCEAQAVERRAHKILSEFLCPSMGREWFQCSPGQAESAIEYAAAQINPGFKLDRLREVTDLIGAHLQDSPLPQNRASDAAQSQ